MQLNSIFLSTKALQDGVDDVVEKVSKLSGYWEKAQDSLVAFGVKLLLVLLIWFIGKKIIKVILHLFDKTFTRSNLEPSVTSFLMAVMKAILYGILVATLVSKIGVDTSSLVAVLGTATLSIGLALQGSLSNFAGGVLILIMKPFRIGDYIMTPDKEGTVTGLDIFYTRMLTADNRLVVIPNGTLSNSNIINVTHEPIRRLDLSVSIDYSENIKKVKDILDRLVSEHELVLKDYDTQIFVNSFNQSSISMGIRMWVNTENYWTLKCDFLEKMKEAFDTNSVAFPFDQLDINITNREAVSK